MRKLCPRCTRKRDLCNFYKNRARPDGHDEYCKACRGEIHAAYVASSPDTIRRVNRAYEARNRKSIRKRRSEYFKTRGYLVRIYKMYGLTEQQYEALVRKYNDQCAICGKPPTERTRLAIDHDHVTGRVRGLLCSLCNIAIGALRHSPELLDSAKKYLRQGF